MARAEDLGEVFHVFELCGCDVKFLSTGRHARIELTEDSLNVICGRHEHPKRYIATPREIVWVHRAAMVSEIPPEQRKTESHLSQAPARVADRYEGGVVHYGRSPAVRASYNLTRVHQGFEYLVQHVIRKFE